MKVKSESEVAQSCLTVCDPVDCSLPGKIHGIFQARVLEWGAITLSASQDKEDGNLKTFCNRKWQHVACSLPHVLGDES